MCCYTTKFFVQYDITRYVSEPWLSNKYTMFLLLEKNLQHAEKTKWATSNLSFNILTKNSMTLSIDDSPKNTWGHHDIPIGERHGENSGDKYSAARKFYTCNSFRNFHDSQTCTLNTSIYIVRNLFLSMIY